MKDTRTVGYHTDVAMKMTWLCLCDDLGISECQPIRAAIARGDIRTVRELIDDFRLSYSLPVNTLKRTRQILDWAKRYRFANDLLSDEDLSLASWRNYSDVQVKVAKPFRTDILYQTGLVSRWRRIARSILGEYTEAEHFERCRFAKKACLGHPAKRKGLDQKLKGPFTGSMEHISFLQRYCETDPTLWDIVHKSTYPIHPAPSLRLSFVPKSFKALRAIMPDSLAGGFYSSGLGEMIKSRLTKAGLNINTLQRRHRKLAMRSSRVSGWENCRVSPAVRLATIDLSSASDSITPQLLSMILPRKWFQAVMKGRIPYYKYNNGTYRLSSACTMGLGHTFPLETLVFYVLTKGIAEWYGPSSSHISVYGDDIILPTEVLIGNGTYPSLVSIFRHIHLTINNDKSFWGWCDFRESCGGDFYRGHDVRPASPKGAASELTPLAYAAFLYRIANTLLKRWSATCIETTLSWISTEVFMAIGEVHVIPSFFPDSSGLKVQPGEFLTVEPETVNFGSPVVAYLLESKPPRRITFELPLFWDGLRTRSGRSSPGPFLKSYEAPSGLPVRKRTIRTKGRYRTVTFLVLSDASRQGGIKPAKSVCPSWNFRKGRRA